MYLARQQVEDHKSNEDDQDDVRGLQRLRYCLCLRHFACISMKTHDVSMKTMTFADGTQVL